MPLGSSSAAPVMRPGPNSLTRGFSVMLLSSLTIALLQKWNGSRAEEGGESQDQDGHELKGCSCHLRLPRAAERRFGGPKASSGHSAGAADAALTASRTTTHAVNLCDLNCREDRLARRRCKGKYGAMRRVARARGRRPSSIEGVLAYGGSLRLRHFGDDLVRNIARHGFVMRELHGVGGAAAGHAAQLPDVAEHLR